MTEKRSVQHRSLQTAFGPSPQILLKQGPIDAQELDFLLRFPVEASTLSPLPFLSPHTWGAIKVQYRLLAYHPFISFYNAKRDLKLSVIWM